MRETAKVSPETLGEENRGSQARAVPQAAHQTSYWRSKATASLAANHCMYI